MDALIASPYTHTFWNEYMLNPHSCEYNLVLDQTIEENWTSADCARRSTGFAVTIFCFTTFWMTAPRNYAG